MASALDKSISIDEAIMLIKESDVSIFDVSGRKFDKQVTLSNQNQKDIVELIKNDFDEKAFYRHKMSGKYHVIQEASGDFAHKINLYFQSEATDDVFVEYEIKYTKRTLSLQDIGSWEDAPINVPHLHESEKKFWDEYDGLPSTLDKPPEKQAICKPAKKGMMYFMKVIYNYVIGNSDY